MRGRNRWFFLAMLLVAAPLSGQTISVTSLMTPQEFHAAGLHKLTPEELAALNGWLQGFTLRVMGLAQNSTT